MDRHEGGPSAARVRGPAPVHTSDQSLWVLRGSRQRYEDGLALAEESVSLFPFLGML